LYSTNIDIIVKLKTNYLLSTNRTVCFCEKSSSLRLTLAQNY